MFSNKPKLTITTEVKFQALKLNFKASKLNLNSFHLTCAFSGLRKQGYSNGPNLCRRRPLQGVPPAGCPPGRPSPPGHFGLGRDFPPNGGRCQVFAHQGFPFGGGKSVWAYTGIIQGTCAILRVVFCQVLRASARIWHPSALLIVICEIGDRVTVSCLIAGRWELQSESGVPSNGHVLVVFGGYSKRTPLAVRMQHRKAGLPL